MLLENISKTERILSMSLGARLLVFGIENIKNKPFSSIAKMLLGSFLLYRGHSGYCPANDSLGLNTAGQTLGQAIDTYTNQPTQSSKIDNSTDISDSVKY